MKITTNMLKKIIREEISKVLNEDGMAGISYPKTSDANKIAVDLTKKDWDGVKCGFKTMEDTGYTYFIFTPTELTVDVADYGVNAPGFTLFGHGKKVDSKTKESTDGNSMTVVVMSPEEIKRKALGTGDTAFSLRFDNGDKFITVQCDGYAKNVAKSITYKLSNDTKFTDTYWKFFESSFKKLMSAIDNSEFKK